MKNKKVTQLFAGLMVTALVVTGTVIPPTTAQAATKSVTIKTQKELDAALKNPKVTTITIKTSKGVTFKIKNGDYDDKKLVIAAPKATVNNYGDFGAISIHDGKTVYDRGENNQIAVSDKNTLTLYAGKQAKNTDITISAKGAKINIVNNGDIAAINVKGKSAVTVSGSAKDAPIITNNATGAKIVTTMDAEVVLNKSASLTVKSGATLESLRMKAGSNVKVSAGATIKQLVIAKTDAVVNLKIDGTVDKVIVEKKATVNVSGATDSTVAVENNAAGSQINSAVKTDVSLNADATISLEKGAEGSTVKKENSDVKADVTNQTTDKVTVTDSDGKDATIDSGKTSEEAKPGTGDTGNNNQTGDSTGDSSNESSGGASGGSSSGGSSSSGGGYYPGGSGVVKKKNFNATPTVDAKSGKVTVTMTEVTGVKFSVDGAEAEFAYAEGKYTYTLTEEGKHSIKISATGYNDQTFEAVYDNTAPVITVAGGITAATVYVSDAPSWNYASVTATDNVDGTLQPTITMKDGEEKSVADVAAARKILSEANKTITVTYNAKDAAGNVAEPKTVTYTSKADVAATKVTITGTAKVGNILTAEPKDDDDQPAGGGLTYEWQIGDSAEGDFIAIPGATDSSYIIPASGVGKYYKVTVKNPNAGEPISSDVTGAVENGTLTPDGDATYDTVLENNTAPSVENLSAAFENVAGQPVEVVLAFVAPNTPLTENTDHVAFTATADGYETYNGEVSIKVKAATPTAEQIKLVTGSENLEQIEIGKTAFAEAHANMKYSVDGLNWSEITTDPIDVPASKKILVRQTGANNEPSDTLEITVETANIGTKKTVLATVSITAPKLVLDGETLKISGEITDSNADELVQDYEVRVYESSTLIAKGTVTSKTLTDTALTLEDEKSFSAATSYTVKVVANPKDTANYAVSAEDTGVAATNQCIVTVNTKNDKENQTVRVNYNSDFSNAEVAAPEKEGYSFTGWFDAASDGSEVSTITGNTTVYAQWVEIKQLTAKEVVSLAFPDDEGITSRNPGLTDDGARRADVWELSGTWNGTDNATLSISGDVAASTLNEKAGDGTTESIPIFLTVLLNNNNLGENANGIKISTTSDEWVWQCVTDAGDWRDAYANFGLFDVNEEGNTAYAKFGKSFATKTDDIWSTAANKTYIIEVYSGMTENADGILVAECTFTVDFSGIHITGQTTASGQ